MILNQGKHHIVHTFAKPMFTNLVMFCGMASCLLIVGYRKYLKKTTC